MKFIYKEMNVTNLHQYNRLYSAKTMNNPLVSDVTRDTPLFHVELHFLGSVSRAERDKYVHGVKLGSRRN